MFKRILLITCFVLIFSSCKKSNPNAQELSFTQNDPHINPTRYEIIQSPLAAKWTFRLDRYKGNVCQLVETRGGNLTWEDMRIIGLEPISDDNQKIRFQIYTSGIAAMHTYLIDLENGDTWYIVRQENQNDEEGEVYWKQFER